ncbi:hypothetical protein [Deminuibacter soli]|uniref:Uncharacterized protein n=1 Tax=Deminuibacter soli TaxID=2291815 RepID=A0A3E1NNW3_9BACT|nr:hypothetical protein [Deminuibacter soli]RFM29626.1 hypothetical protein DXN05_01180 [Deminuibacter soli]
MRRYFVFSLALLAVLALSCSKKTVPAKNVNAAIVYPDKNGNTTATPAPGTPAAPGTTTPAAPVTNERILVILDKGGRLAASQSSLPPYVAANTKQLPQSTPLTAEQRNNLLARQKTLLPLALYVPDAYAGKSPRGQFYKYKSKFWYWKKADGFYYLDEIYYK